MAPVDGGSSLVTSCFIYDVIMEVKREESEAEMPIGMTRIR